MTRKTAIILRSEHICSIAYWIAVKFNINTSVKHKEEKLIVDTTDINMLTKIYGFIDGFNCAKCD